MATTPSSRSTAPFRAALSTFSLLATPHSYTLAQAQSQSITLHHSHVKITITHRLPLHSSWSQDINPAAGGQAVRCGYL